VLDIAMADHFRAFADVVERDGGTTYATICRGIAADDDVLSLLDAAPPAQQRPLLLLAAVHFLLLSGADHPLAAFYDTVAAVRGADRAADRRMPDDVASVFARFCAERRGELEELIATRTTQTNEIGRCNALLPGLCQVAELHGREAAISLLDLGTSAGLNLLFDDYAFTYRTPEGDRLDAGRESSRVRLRCTIRRGLDNLPDLALPAMGERVGLDLSPVDLHSDGEARWLLACQWPDNPERFGRFRAAVENARSSGERARLEHGDMVADLADVAARMRGNEPLVVFHSWVAAYLDEERQRALAAEVRALDGVGGRPVHHLYLEASYETPGLPTPPPPPGLGPRRDLATALVLVPAGGGEPVRLADAHPHGRWLRWWPATRPVPMGHRGARVPAHPPR
jgi:hypothetical protein